MARTEILNALKRVRAAEKETAEMLINAELTGEERNLLQSCRDELVDLEDKLILEDIIQSVKELQNDAKDLQALTVKMKQTAGSLGKIATVVGEVAKVVGTLADILSKASGAGLI
jgi:hypothetical protein